MCRTIRVKLRVNLAECKAEDKILLFICRRPKVLHTLTHTNTHTHTTHMLGYFSSFLEKPIDF